MIKSGAVLLTLLAAPNLAEAANSSVYTKFDLAKCLKLDTGNADEGDSGSWLCKGYGNLKIYFAEGDLRSLLAFGKAPQKHCAAQQTFGGFNSVSTIIEWRLNKGKPIAAIQRWTVSYDPEDSAKTKTWLVVTRIESSNSCHMAEVEGSYPNANTKAREIADQLSATFKCDTDLQKVISIVPLKSGETMTNGTCEKN